MYWYGWNEKTSLYECFNELGQHVVGFPVEDDAAEFCVKHNEALDKAIKRADEEY
jgi:hypothetical protein